MREHNEHKALIDMVDRSTIPKALVIADRGYESYNNMAHIQEKGWKFLIRIEDGAIGIKSSFEVPDEAYKTVLTNKDRAEYLPEILTKLYAARWGIETSSNLEAIIAKYIIPIRSDRHRQRIMITSNKKS